MERKLGGNVELGCEKVWFGGGPGWRSCWSERSGFSVESSAELRRAKPKPPSPRLAQPQPVARQLLLTLTLTNSHVKLNLPTPSQSHLLSARPLPTAHPAHLGFDPGTDRGLISS